jgi:hypothetical protein
MIGKTIAELTAGDRAEITRVVEQDDLISAVIGTRRRHARSRGGAGRGGARSRP